MAEKPITLSPTKIDTFQGCRRLYKYRYISKPFIPLENRYFLIGNVVHKALETIHREHLASPIKKWGKAMGEHFKGAVATHNVYQKIKEEVITKDDLFMMRSMLLNYLRYLRKSEALPQVVKVEELKKITIAGITVWLKADRIDKVGKGAYRVIDYKSGRPSPKKDELESVQIPSYGMLVRQIIDKNAEVEGSYYYLKFMNKRSGVHNYKVTNEWMDKATAQYAKVYKELGSGSCEFRQNYKYKYCWGCDYKRHCLEDKNNGL